jgi:origin recognition complex subunit 1
VFVFSWVLSVQLNYVQHYDFFEEDAVLFAARKTAALSGDVRKAFQICRVAAETITTRFESDCSAHPYPKINVSDVQKASHDSFNKAIVTAVSVCSPLQALLLIALASLCRISGREIGGFDVHVVITKMGAIAEGSGDPQYRRPPSFSETIQLANLLGEVRFLSFVN